MYVYKNIYIYIYTGAYGAGDMQLQVGISWNWTRCRRHPMPKLTTRPSHLVPPQGVPELYHPPTHLPLVSREWKNGSNSSYNCTPFLHSLLTKGKPKPTQPNP